MQQEALARADIEHAHARFDTVCGDHRVRHLAPTAIVFVAAIAGLAAAVPIVVVEFHRHFGHFGLVALRDARLVVSLGRFVDEADELPIGHYGSFGLLNSSGENFAELRSGFFDLPGATLIPFIRSGKGSARGADRQEIVENDADPFYAAGVEQKTAP